MAARTKTEIVEEARRIVATHHIDMIKGENAGALNTIAGESSTQFKVFVSLLLLIIELLSNIRQNETNP